jgi:hypothetical protein
MRFFIYHALVLVKVLIDFPELQKTEAKDIDVAFARIDILYPTCVIPFGK